MKVIAYALNGVTIVCPGCMPTARKAVKKGENDKTPAEVHGAACAVSCATCGAVISKNREYGVWPPRKGKSKC